MPFKKDVFVHVTTNPFNIWHSFFHSPHALCLSSQEILGGSFIVW